MAVKKALIIDDTKNIRLLLTKCLEIEGYTVACAVDGAEGLEKIEQEDWDLIFLDIKLPQISGTEIMRQIRRRHLGVRVVIITAYPTIANAVACTQLGAAAYLRKPFTAERLHKVLAELEEQSITVEDNCWDALHTAKAKLAKDPTNAAIYRTIAQCYAQLGQEELSEKFLKAADIFGL